MRNPLVGFFHVVMGRMRRVDGADRKEGKFFNRLLGPLGLGFVLLWCVGSATAQVVPPGTSVAGQTMGEWIEAWAKWAFAAPPGVHTSEVDGTFNHLGQDGPVWFLGTSEIGTREKTIAIPADKYVLAPVLISWAADPSNERDLAAEARQLQDDWSSAYFELDDFSIPQQDLLTTYRESTGVFSFEFPPPNCCSETETASGYAAFDGIWLMLEPLSPGQHTTQHGGNVSDGGLPAQTTRQLFSFDNPADFDFDGDVDSADRTIQTAHWTGASMLGQGDRMLFIHGDTDFDGDIDTADQTVLIRNWTGALQLASPSPIVPEPSGAILALLGLMTTMHRRRCRTE